MIIKRYEPKVMPFARVRQGNVMTRKNGDIIMKIQSKVHSIPCNAVALDDGRVLEITDDEVVTLIDAQLNIR